MNQDLIPTPDELRKTNKLILRGTKARTEAGRMRWCGPAALSIITGLPYRQCEEMISVVRGSPFKDSSTVGEVTTILEHCGVRFTPTQNGILPFRITVRNFARTHREGVWFLRVGNHFMVLCNGEVFDTLGPRSAARVRCFVTHAYKCYCAAEEVRDEWI